MSVAEEAVITAVVVVNHAALRLRRAELERFAALVAE